MTTRSVGFPSGRGLRCLLTKIMCALCKLLEAFNTLLKLLNCGNFFGKNWSARAVQNCYIRKILSQIIINSVATHTHITPTELGIDVMNRKQLKTAFLALLSPPGGVRGGVGGQGTL